jgi:hypothetical protein
MYVLTYLGFLYASIYIFLPSAGASSEMKFDLSDCDLLGFGRVDWKYWATRHD